MTAQHSSEETGLQQHLNLLSTTLLLLVLLLVLVLQVAVMQRKLSDPQTVLAGFVPSIEGERC
jgi:hypothetical protein